MEVSDLDASPVAAIVDGQEFEVYIEEPGMEAPSVPEEGKSPPRVTAAPVLSVPSSSIEPESPGGAHVTAPMPGDIVEILVKPGDQVKIGQELCSLEAMKMKNAIRSPREGVVASVEIAPGQSVVYGEVLVKFE